ncbi:MAG: hypothetical protein ABR591_16515 [Candidatus Velthaea sp.]
MRALEEALRRDAARERRRRLSVAPEPQTVAPEPQTVAPEPQTVAPASRVHVEKAGRAHGIVATGAKISAPRAARSRAVRMNAFSDRASA